MTATSAASAAASPDPLAVLDPARMAAWCVVPYDTRERGATARAAMLKDLGLSGLVWDWRAEHGPRFGSELDALTARKLKLHGLWVPHLVPAGDDGVGEIVPEVEGFVAESARRGLTPQLWTCLEFGSPGAVTLLGGGDQARAVRHAADHVEPLADLAGEHGMRVALYNHLGWAGEPTNQVAVIDMLGRRGIDNVGIVYQQHHGHHHFGDFESVLAMIRPHLLALGLNGMVPGAHWGGRKIHPYGRGPRDVDLARTLVDSGWDGLVTILGHTMDDAEDRLRDNLDGVAWVRAQLDGREAQLPPARVPQPVWPH